MLKTLKIKRIFLYILTTIFVFNIFCTSLVLAQEEPFSKLKEKMTNISGKERDILENLFVMIQEIEKLESEQEGIAKDIEGIKQEIEKLQRNIEEEENLYKIRQENLKKVLKSYQRMGAGTYLEIILSSDNLPTLLRRINTLRDITRNTGKLLEQLEDSKAKQLSEKAKLTEKLGSMEDKKNQLAKSLSIKKQVKDDKEKYLSLLGEEREYYQQYLNNIVTLWEELKSFFKATMKELSFIIEKGDLPQDALKITYNFLNIKGTIEDNSLNNIFAQNSKLPKMILTFYLGKVELEVPEKNLILSGTFVIIEGQTLKLKVEEGSFYGMTLEKGAIEELLKEDYLSINLKPLLGSFVLSSLEIKDGYLEMSIIPELGRQQK